MNKMKWMVLFMSITIIFSGCASMNNTGKGAAIGGGSGAALGAILGGVIGKGKGAAIGAAIGTAVGAGTGALIGKKMDKAAAEAKQIEGAQVEQITDNNGLQAVKVTFDSGILFTTGNATLSAAAKSALSKFANNVLNQKQRHGRIHLWIYRQSGLEKQYCRTKSSEESELVTGTCTECSQLFVELRRFIQPD